MVMKHETIYNSLYDFKGSEAFGYNSKLWKWSKSIAEGFGLSVVYTYKGKYGYENSRIRVTPSRRASLDLLHELCHWIICSPDRRNREEFGLGPGFSTDGYVKRFVRPDTAQKEEEIVCILSFLILKEQGYSPKNEMNTTYFEDVYYKEYKRLFDYLIDNGIIDEDYKWTGKVI